MIKILIIVVLLFVCAILGYLLYKNNSDLVEREQKVKDKIKELEKREQELVIKEKCSVKLATILERERNILTIVRSNLEEFQDISTNSSNTVEL